MQLLKKYENQEKSIKRDPERVEKCSPGPGTKKLWYNAQDVYICLIFLLIIFGKNNKLEIKSFFIFKFINFCQNPLKNTPEIILPHCIYRFKVENPMITLPWGDVIRFIIYVCTGNPSISLELLKLLCTYNIHST